MTVESNYAIAIATVGDWFKNIAPIYQPTRAYVSQHQSRLAHAICSAPSASYMVTNSNWFTELFAPAAIGWRF